MGNQNLVDLKFCVGTVFDAKVILNGVNRVSLNVAICPKGSLYEQSARLSGASVVTLKPAICGQFKTGHRDWPKT
jgi:hypothetical protein